MSDEFKTTLQAIATVVLVVLIVLFVLPSFLRGCVGSGGHAHERTRAHLYFVDVATRVYFDDYGRWPTSLADFTNNPRGIIYLELGPAGLVDGWRHPIVYRPYDLAIGYGSATSLGRDGKLGGTGFDADIEVRFSDAAGSTNQASEAIGAPSAPQPQR